ncbi:hypothetical protein GCM10009787_63010 [Streptomyces bangladeshensis]|uniref:Uncharacterized protein n=1 Tax=Streptomyces bangladeshensis TaxID=295352 RepID=A0ABN3C0M5_9ACTN
MRLIIMAVLRSARRKGVSPSSDRCRATGGGAAPRGVVQRALRTILPLRAVSCIRAAGSRGGTGNTRGLRAYGGASVDAGHIPSTGRGYDALSGESSRAGGVRAAAYARLPGERPAPRVRARLQCRRQRL